MKPETCYVRVHMKGFRVACGVYFLFFFSSFHIIFVVIKQINKREFQHAALFKEAHGFLLLLFCYY
jgi:hypothetical protein